jgi:predicted nucleic acid-binding protein
MKKCLVCPREHHLSDEVSKMRLLGICCGTDECLETFWETERAQEVFDWDFQDGVYWFSYY